MRHRAGELGGSDVDTLQGEEHWHRRLMGADKVRLTDGRTAEGVASAVTPPRTRIGETDPPGPVAEAKESCGICAPSAAKEAAD